jgi:hypothetical protein
MSEFQVLSGSRNDFPLSMVATHVLLTAGMDFSSTGQTAPQFPHKNSLTLAGRVADALEADAGASPMPVDFFKAVATGVEAVGIVRLFPHFGHGTAKPAPDSSTSSC